MKFAFVLFLIISQNSLAEQITSEAISSVQADLKDRAAREKMIHSLPKADGVDQQVKSLTGGSKISEDEIYAIAADILGNYNGKDNEQVARDLASAEKNPEAFFNSLSPEQKKKIQNAASNLPQSKKMNP